MPSGVSGGNGTSRCTPNSANAAAFSFVSRPRGVTVISSGAEVSGRAGSSAAAASNAAIDAAAASGVSANPYQP